MKKLFVIAAVALAVVACTKEFDKAAFVAEVENAIKNNDTTAIDSLKNIYVGLDTATVKFEEAQKHYLDSVFAIAPAAVEEGKKDAAAIDENANVEDENANVEEENEEEEEA